MKTIRSLLMMLAFVAAGVLHTGCAGTGASCTEAILSAAGFVSRSPETNQQRQLFVALPPYKVHRGT